MRLVKLTMLKRITVLSLILACFYSPLSAQDNSPYSRYGLGDISPQSNILNRGMGGVSAAYSDLLYVNFVNPASFSTFRTNKILETNETVSGRVVLDAGINFDSRTIREANRPDKFTSPNTYFSYLQLGIPVAKNWGIAAGLRPMTKIGYRLQTQERLSMDSAVTQYRGDGGSYLASIGTGFAIKNFSIGGNFGYLFGKKDYSSERTLINDTVAYARGNFQTKTSFGGIFLSGGLQQKFILKKDAKTGQESSVLRLGVYGNLKHNLNASKDFLRETFTRDLNSGYLKIDSVYAETDTKGEIVYPANFGAGLIYEKSPTSLDRGFQIGADYVMSKWGDYRYYNVTDLVTDSKEFRVGLQLLPPVYPNRSYWKNVAYRAGFFAGNDNINVGGNLPVFGVSGGISLPVLGLKDPQSRYRSQYTVVNISLEYIKRGNNNSLLKENLFRLSAGFSLSDNWFTKRKYN